MDRVISLIKVYNSLYTIPYYERVDIEKNIDITIEETMKEWAESMPSSVIELYGSSLLNLRGIVLTHKPSYSRIYAILNEVYIKYTTRNYNDIYITLTPTSVIVQYSAYSLHDKTFPLEWDCAQFVVPKPISNTDESILYKDFLSSPYVYLLVISSKKIKTKILLEEIQKTPITVQLMVQDEPIQILDTPMRSLNMYDEPLQIKHIIHRTTYDNFARTLVALEEKQCMVVEFKDS
jgi:hypothetical protein